MMDAALKIYPRRGPGRPAKPPENHAVRSGVSLTPEQWRRARALIYSYPPEHRPRSLSALLGRLVDEAYQSCPFGAY